MITVVLTLLGIIILGMGIFTLIWTYRNEIRELIAEAKQETNKSYTNELKEKFKTGVEVDIETNYLFINDEHYINKSEYHNLNIGEVLRRCKIVGWVDNVLFVRQMRSGRLNLIKPTSEKDTVTLYKVENIYNTETGSVVSNRTDSLELKEVYLSKRNNIEIEANNATISATITSINVHNRKDNMQIPNLGLEPSKEVYSVNVTEDLAKQIVENHKITNSAQIRHQLALLQKKREEVINMESIYNEELNQIETQIKEKLRV